MSNSLIFKNENFGEVRVAYKENKPKIEAFETLMSSKKIMTLKYMIKLVKLILKLLK